ncbi:MAG: mannose-1-phosphate guanylyltransferase/mannose-6-phosphate isomerase [Gallionella sp.]|nr:mannose-1-phosphate guanylyltransferase/mannose-6-phosphate isomerase [Gallionella sp.]
MTKLIPTILCGGAGSRLWPVSRESHPKPFIRLADDQSLLQKAWLRGAVLPDAAEILTVTNRELFFKSAEEFHEVAGIPDNKKLPTRFILEPFGRNTAPAIAAAALYAANIYGEDACLLVLPADHLIADQAAFADAVAEAIKLAATGKLVTFGILPNEAATGYGYIEADGNIVKSFVEKPDQATAERYLASGKYLWNSGMFCFQVGTMLQEMQLHCPAILEATRECLENSRQSEDRGTSKIDLDAETFEGITDNSIDYEVMEKSHNVAVVSCDIGWSDIGSWTALGDITPADHEGNRTEGEVVLHNVSGCYIRGSNPRMVAAVGIRDLVIVDTPDAVLVADKNSAQDVKHIYARLKSEGHEAHRLHRTVFRPWGSYTVLEEGIGYKIKRIVVSPGASLSLQMHHHRSEHWIVVSGMAKVVNGEREIYVNSNESTYIPAGHRHRLENPGLLDLVMIEVQSGQYLGEDDIVRMEDVYGRN